MDLLPGAFEGYENVKPIIDAETGYALNLPLGLQVEPGWAQAKPEMYAHIVAVRKELGIVIEDDLLVGDAPDEEYVDALAAWR